MRRSFYKTNMRIRADSQPTSSAHFDVTTHTFVSRHPQVSKGHRSPATMCVTYLLSCELFLILLWVQYTIYDEEYIHLDVPPLRTTVHSFHGTSRSHNSPRILQSAVIVPPVAPPPAAAVLGPVAQVNGEVAAPRLEVDEARIRRLGDLIFVGRSKYFYYRSTDTNRFDRNSWLASAAPSKDTQQRFITVHLWRTSITTLLPH